MSLINEEVFTEKGAKSYSTDLHDPRVVLFMKTVRGVLTHFLDLLLEKSWNISPLDTLRLIFYIRDCREGKGEKKIFDNACLWLLKNHLPELQHNAQHIPFYGSWKDLPRIFGGTEFETNAIQIHVNQLRVDKAKIGTDQQNTIDTSAAKFAPSEGCEYDKSWAAVSKYAKLLGVNKAAYRKEFLRPLRSARAPIVEELMCSGEWEKIDFSQVPSVAMKRYNKAFMKHDPVRFREFCMKVMSGQNPKIKINVNVLTPVEILRVYTKNKSVERLTTPDDVAEAQWKQLVADRKAKRIKIAETTGVKPSNALAVIDVSGSMFCKNGGVSAAPIDVSLSLGLLIALLNDEDSPFYRKWINFSTKPSIQTIKGESLFDILKNIDWTNWMESTNFQSVFDLILETAQLYNVPEDRMPKMLIVISDMQFDSASGRRTNWEEIERKYTEKGYTRPTIVFWDARSNIDDIPVPHSEIRDCTLVGGYSANILDPLIDGVILTPLSLVRKVIDSPRYARITLPNVPSIEVIEE